SRRTRRAGRRGMLRPTISDCGMLSMACRPAGKAAAIAAARSGAATNRPMIGKGFVAAIQPAAPAAAQNPAHRPATAAIASLAGRGASMAGASAATRETIMAAVATGPMKSSMASSGNRRCPGTWGASKDVQHHLLRALPIRMGREGPSEFPMPYTAQHKLATRQKILESARRLFNTKGFAAVSIEEVMTEAGLTHGGFYRHFSGKDEL